MRTTAPTQHLEVYEGYIQLSKQEFERMLQERDALVMALREAIKRNRELIALLGSSITDHRIPDEDPPIPTRIKFRSKVGADLYERGDYWSGE